MIKENSAAAIIFYLDQNKPIFLLLKYKNYWGFVKGVIENKESVEETIKREAREEANITKLNIIPGFQQKTHFFYKLNGNLISKDVFFLLAEIGEEQAKKIKISWEHEGFRLLSYEEALKIIKYKDETEILNKANSFIQEYKKQRRLI